MFYLYQSNRLESLAALFAGIQRVRPLESALAAEQIVVQSQGMRRYLSVYLARELGVAANLQFSLPAGLTWQLMQKLIPDIPALSPFSPEVMRWRLLDLFRSERFQTASEFENVRSVLQSYLGSGESADYQLAGQLADIFDQYLVYRPQWIDAWQEGKLLGLGDDEVWQAQLWRYLDDGNQSAPHRVALWEKLLSSLDKAHLPERFFVFGISTMAPMYLQLLQKISEHCDVFVFALNPSGQYWGNVIEAAQLLKGGDDADLSQTGHPLLASLGKQGRDFFDFLTEIGLEEQPVFEEVSDDTLLHCLQNDIQNLRMPSENSRADLLDDGSVRIVSAHSPLRELQILKDKLLRILHEHPDWQPHDIAVLTPNIEPYSPFIEAVFGQAQGGAQALPYSVSDVKLSRRQPLLYALEQTLDLLESRFEVDKVLPLLESGLVLRRFGLTADDLPLLHDTIAELNVHWGLDGTMRGAADNLFTWQQALERIVLGWMLPDDGSPLWQNVSAWHGDVNRLDVFGRFAAFIRTLSRLAAEWRKPAAAEEWTERCRDLVQSLFLPDADDQYALQQFEQALAKWQEETELAGFSGTLPQHTVIRHIRRFLGSESQAGFLRGGITFCSMVPMRSLPFKVICLLGLNDGDFPRNTKAAVFDLIAKHPQKGDRARRQNQDFQETAVRLDAESLLPAGELGKLWQQNFQAAAKRIDGALLQSPKLPPFAYEIPFDGQTLQGSLGNLYQCGQVFYLDRKPNAPQRIALLLEHLIFCAVGPSETETRQTHIVQPEETTLYPEISGSQAQQMLQKWLTFFNLGQTRPLPFFAKTSLAAAEAYGKKQSWEDALNKARESYHGNKVSKGQKDYTEVALVFGNEDTEPVEGALFQRLVEELLIPLLDAVKEESSDAA